MLEVWVDVSVPLHLAWNPSELTSHCATNLTNIRLVVEIVVSGIVLPVTTLNRGEFSSAPLWICKKKCPQIKKSVMSKIAYRVLLVLMIAYFTGKTITSWTIYCKSICKHYDYFLLEPASYHNKILFAENKMPSCLNQIETK